MNEEAILFVISSEPDEDGFAKEKIIKQTSVCVEEKSVKYTEFYDALRAGLSPRIILEMRIEDWDEATNVFEDGRKERPSVVEYDGETHKILRTYKKNKAYIQLTCGDTRITR